MVRMMAGIFLGVGGSKSLHALSQEHPNETKLIFSAALSSISKSA
jgi:hypothetical protein